jgi:hypothetical protein
MKLSATDVGWGPGEVAMELLEESLAAVSFKDWWLAA